MRENPVNPDPKSEYGFVPMICSIVFLTYIAVVLINIPPFVKADHVAVNMNKLIIGAVGTPFSLIALAAVLFLPVSKYLGRVSVGVIGFEAVASFILSLVLIYSSLSFFGII